MHIWTWLLIWTFSVSIKKTPLCNASGTPCLILVRKLVIYNCQVLLEVQFVTLVLIQHALFWQIWSGKGSLGCGLLLVQLSLNDCVCSLPSPLHKGALEDYLVECIGDGLFSLQTMQRSHLSEVAKMLAWGMAQRSIVFASVVCDNVVICYEENMT